MPQKDADGQMTFGNSWENTARNTAMSLDISWTWHGFCHTHKDCRDGTYDLFKSFSDDYSHIRNRLHMVRYFLMTSARNASRTPLMTLCSIYTYTCTYSTFLDFWNLLKRLCSICTYSSFLDFCWARKDYKWHKQHQQLKYQSFGIWNISTCC